MLPRDGSACRARSIGVAGDQPGAPTYARAACAPGSARSAAGCESTWGAGRTGRPRSGDATAAASTFPQGSSVQLTRQAVVRVGVVDAGAGDVVELLVGTGLRL